MADRPAELMSLFLVSYYLRVRSFFGTSAKGKAGALVLCGGGGGAEWARSAQRGVKNRNWNRVKKAILSLFCEGSLSPVPGWRYVLYVYIL